jgi:hypothetical protein
MVRHEFDHVLQTAAAGRCASDSTFSVHERRERAAYLNDAHFSADSRKWALSEVLGYPATP